MSAIRAVYISRNFRLDEFRCTDGTPVPDRYLDNVVALCHQLEIIRAACGNRPMTILSGYRSPKFNRSIGGAKKSQHLLAKAADIVVASMPSKELHRTIEGLIKTGDIPDGGLGLYRNFCHYDIRSKPARWRG